jgi:hypothetical protein
MNYSFGMMKLVFHSKENLSTEWKLKLMSLHYAPFMQ